MSQFLKGAERKRGWKTLERNLHLWLEKNADKENWKMNSPVNAGKTDSDSASSTSKIPNVYQIQQEPSSEGQSDASSEDSLDEINESVTAGTCPQSPAPNPGYNCWTKSNGTPTGSRHDSILGMTPSEDATGFHSWESFSLNDMFS